MIEFTLIFDACFTRFRMHVCIEVEENLWYIYIGTRGKREREKESVLCLLINRHDGNHKKTKTLDTVKRVHTTEMNDDHRLTNLFVVVFIDISLFSSLSVSHLLLLTGIWSIPMMSLHFINLFVECVQLITDPSGDPCEQIIHVMHSASSLNWSKNWQLTKRRRRRRRRRSKRRHDNADYFEFHLLWKPTSLQMPYKLWNRTFYATVDWNDISHFILIRSKIHTIYFVSFVFFFVERERKKKKWCAPLCFVISLNLMAIKSSLQLWHLSSWEANFVDSLSLSLFLYVALSHVETVEMCWNCVWIWLKHGHFVISSFA